MCTASYSAYTACTEPQYICTSGVCITVTCTPGSSREAVNDYRPAVAAAGWAVQLSWHQRFSPRQVASGNPTTDWQPCHPSHCAQCCMRFQRHAPLPCSPLHKSQHNPPVSPLHHSVQGTHSPSPVAPPQKALPFKYTLTKAPINNPKIFNRPFNPPNPKSLLGRQRGPPRAAAAQCSLTGTRFNPCPQTMPSQAGSGGRHPLQAALHPLNIIDLLSFVPSLLSVHWLTGVSSVVDLRWFRIFRWGVTTDNGAAS